MFIRRSRAIKVVFLFCCILAVAFFLNSQMCLQNGGCGNKVSNKERVPWLRRSKSHEEDNEIKADDRCIKTILLYGMKENWQQFCTSTVKSRFKSLVQFPKTFTCPEAQCRVLLKYSDAAIDIKGADIVLFSNTLNWLTDETWKWAHGNRSEGQLWMFISRESPIHSPGLRPPEEFVDSTYHWIASYKFDSEIYLPFGFYEPFTNLNQERFDLTAFSVNKSKLAVWASDSCKSLQWDRVGFVNSLNDIIRIDKLGACGHRKKAIPWTNDLVLGQLFQPYKFSLSLENSCCDDFITENFWTALKFGSVPIVVGASYLQYSRIAPPNSFIHVDQFETMEELAVYLTFLDENDEKYLEFHKWRNLGSITSYNVDEKYVEPLTLETHCEILQKYMTSIKPTETLDYLGQRWARSCSFCGYKWIQSFGRRPNP